MAITPTALKALDDAAVLLGPELLHRSGGVLVSGIDTLVNGDYYVMAYNPGGNRETPTINDTLATSHNTLSHNDWTGEGEDEPLKGRVKSVFAGIGAEPERVFCTNALFVRSTQQVKLEGAWDLWWSRCWPVHQLFLNIVRPRVVVCLGSDGNVSAWAKLQHASSPVARKYTRHWENEPDEAVANGKWRDSVTLDLGEYGSHTCSILGLPHPGKGNPAPWPLSPTALAKLAQARAAAGR
jgi:hypothetical protein